MASQFVQFQSKQKNPENPGVEDIDPKELWEKRAEVVIVDVRRPDEYSGELGHIAGSEHMVLDTLPLRFDELPQERTLVFVCRSGARSGRATAFAHSQGHTSAYNMKGGMLLWNELNLQTESRNEG
ncbi:MAG: rhodanese-like domain-containing protein [Bdellovibrionales bacterium]